MFVQVRSLSACSTKCFRERYGNFIIRASVLKGSPVKALLDYKTMLVSSAFRPDHRTLSLVLEASRRSNNLNAAMEAHSRIIKSGLDSHASFVSSSLFVIYLNNDRVVEAEQLFDEIPEKVSDPVYGNLMIMGFVRNGDIEQASKVFNGMPLRDLVSWNSMIGACARHSRPEQAISLFRGMLDSGFEPDGFTFSPVLSACAQVGALGHGERAHHVMVEKGVGLNHILRSALIDMYAKCGRIKVARDIFGAVRKDNVSVWNSMITGLAIHGLGFEALDVFSRMELEGVAPDGVTFVGVLTACSHCGMVEEGRRYFHAMKERYSIVPQIEHFGAMVDMLARTGLLEEAYEAIRLMPMNPDSAIWRALLSACRKYRRPDLAEVTIKQMVHRDCGDYVLLSSVYSSAQRWHCAESVWAIMKERRIRKGRGLSWVELGGRVHQFKAGDRSHGETNSIYNVLQDLTKRVKVEGYEPVTELVRMDVSEEEKEENLIYHSDKLAIAFSVLNTRPGAEIRVAKNLQTCEDCHNWAKLVSKVLCRVITLRDRLRFHRFENGSCSCGDYW